MKKILIAALLLIMAAPVMVNAQGCVEASSEEGVQVVGYVQGEFNYESSGELGAGESFDQNSFFLRRARIGVVGNIPYDISYYVMTELSPSTGGPYLLDAFITWHGLGPWAKISIGQFKSPFGLELTTPCQSLHTINRSKVVSTLANPFRDMGIMISGSTDTLSIFGLEKKNIFSYNLAFLNGTGMNQEDTDKYKDIVARVIFAPFDYISFGTSYRTGKSANADLTILTPDKRTRFGLDMSVNYKNFLVQAEYIKGKDEGTIYVGEGGCGGGLTAVPGTAESKGYMIQALYMTPWKLQPVVKYECYDENINEDFDKVSTLTFGFNYFINEWTRVQVNYLYNVEESSDTNIANYFEHPNDMFMVQVQVRF